MENQVALIDYVERLDQYSSKSKAKPSKIISNSPLRGLYLKWLVQLGVKDNLDTKEQNDLIFAFFLFLFETDLTLFLTVFGMHDFIRFYWEEGFLSKKEKAALNAIILELETVVIKRLLVQPLLIPLAKNYAIAHATYPWHAYAMPIAFISEYMPLYYQRIRAWEEISEQRLIARREVHNMRQLNQNPFIEAMVNAAFNGTPPALPANIMALPLEERHLAVMERYREAMEGIVLESDTNQESVTGTTLHNRYKAACERAYYLHIINEEVFLKLSQTSYRHADESLNLTALQQADDEMVARLEAFNESVREVMLEPEARVILAEPYQAWLESEEKANEKLEEIDNYYLPILQELEHQMADLGTAIAEHHAQYVATLLEVLSTIPPDYFSTEQNKVRKECANKIKALQAAYQKNHPEQLAGIFNQYTAELATVLKALQSREDGQPTSPEVTQLAAVLQKEHDRLQAAAKEIALVNASKSATLTERQPVEPTHEFKTKLDEMHQEAPVDIPKHAEQYLTTKEELITTFETYHLELKQDTACPQEIIKLSEAVMAQVALLIQSHYKKTSLSGIDKVSEKCDELSLHTPLPPEIENIVSVLVELKEKMTCENSALKPHS